LLPNEDAPEIVEMDIEEFLELRKKRQEAERGQAASDGKPPTPGRATERALRRQFRG